LFPSADAPKQGRKIAFFNIQRPAQPSPEIAQCFNGGYGRLQVKYRRCETYASIPLEHIRRPRTPDTEAAQMPIVPDVALLSAGWHD
jgi:hypothetical protein